MSFMVNLPILQTKVLKEKGGKIIDEKLNSMIGIGMMLATAPKVDVYMDCQLILKQQVFFLLLHHKEEVALLAGLHWPLFGSFTVTCWRLLAHTVYGIHSVCPYSVWHTLANHRDTQPIAEVCHIILHWSEECESSCTVKNQGEHFCRVGEVAGPSASSFGMLLPRVQPYLTSPYHIIHHDTISYHYILSSHLSCHSRH